MFRTATFLVCCVAFGGFVGVSAAAAGPTADAGLDQTVTVDTTVQLDATGSTHSDGAIEAYEWTIETPDGRRITPACTDCEQTRFSPSVPGRYEVTLSVTDSGGTAAEDTLYVYVDDAGPSVELSGRTAPEPGELIEFEATAESPDAELAEIAWAVDDEIVAARSLSGDTDESSFELAFVEPVTHRVQVVVRDSNGRTAYDHVFVQPQGRGSRTVENPPPVGPKETGEPDCQNADYLSNNADECLDVRADEPTPEPEPEKEPDGSDSGTAESELIYYETDGYYARQSVGSEVTDSSFINLEVDTVGLDGGENAPWKQSLPELAYDSTIGEASTHLFGQEKETVTCEIGGGEANACARQARELEEDGGTTNYHSPNKGGAYSKYGLQGAERIEGSDPAELEDGQRAEVVIVIQPEREGAVHKAAQSIAYAADSSAEALEDAADTVQSVREGAANRVTENLLAGVSEENTAQNPGGGNSDGPTSPGSSPGPADDLGDSLPTGLTGFGRTDATPGSTGEPPSDGRLGSNVGVI